jgi:hypothetical protein
MLSQENQEKHNQCITKINNLTEAELLAMLKTGKCPYEPEHLVGVPLGMFHCEVCGLMVCAGLPHNTIKWIGETYREGYADFPDEVYEQMMERRYEPEV